MKNIRKKQGGITLIALVVTIIVLLILAGIAISMLSGSNGILNKAAEAKVNTDNSTIEEKVKLAAMGAITNKDHKIANQSSLETQLNSQGLSGYTLTAGTNGYTLEVNELKYSIGENGSVAEVVAQWTWTDSQEEGDEGYGEVSVGDLITSKKKTREQFYVIGIDGDTVSLLAKYNLKSDGSEQDTGANNTCAFSSTNYWDPDGELSYPLANGKYPNLNDTTTYPPGTATSIVTTAEAYGESLDVTGRLMTVEEVEYLGGSIDDESTSSCPAFIYAQAYWIGSAISREAVWYVGSYRELTTFAGDYEVGEGGGAQL